MARLSIGNLLPRMNRSVLSALLLAVFLPTSSALYGQWSTDPLVNTPLCTAAGDQLYPQIVGDGHCGAIVAWQDFRNGNADIYAQHVDASGIPQWQEHGVAVCLTPSSQVNMKMIGDGSCGAIIAWTDTGSGSIGIRVQKITAAGSVQWTAGGVLVCASATGKGDPQLVGDGTGGAIIVWSDDRNGASDIYAQRVNASGVVQWTANGMAVCAAPGSQTDPQCASDDAGGVIVTWADARSGAYDIYAQRVLSTGMALWTANGITVCTAAGNQTSPKIVGNNARGAIIGWLDARSTYAYVYAQDVDQTGMVKWTSNGVAVCTYMFGQSGLRIITDGAGGAIFAWQELFARHITAGMQHVNAAGTVQWAADGVSFFWMDDNDNMQFCMIPDGRKGAIISYTHRRGSLWTNTYDAYTLKVDSSGRTHMSVPTGFAVGDQASSQLTSDGAGGAIITWYDSRSGSNADIYVQNFDASCRLGCPPSIVEVKDVPNDQGGRVLLLWEHSHIDVPENPMTGAGYEIFRGVTASASNPSFAVLAEKEYPHHALMQRPSAAYLTTHARSSSGEPIYWEFIRDIPARQLEHYSAAIPTLSDSGPQGSAQYYYMIRAYNSPSVYWDSQPDSGWSVDNLPPNGVGALAARLLPDSTVRLHWPANTNDPDITCYHVYRSTTRGFTPDESALLTQCLDTTYIDTAPPASPAAYYRVAARDLHGNIGEPSAEISVSLIVTHAHEDGQLPAEFALGQNYPNPFNPSTIIRYALPAAAHVTLEVYNTLGARVAVIVDGDEGAGFHSAAFNAAGLASGIYFYRLQAGTFHSTKKLILMR